MPNHIKNRLEILNCSDERLNEVIKRFGTFVPDHFNRTYDGSWIICRNKNTKEFAGWYDPETDELKNRGPIEIEVISKGMPDDVEKEVIKAHYHFPDFSKVIPPPENMFIGGLTTDIERQCAMEGIPTWYEWRPKNWGTKWNSYECERPENNVFLWETAWAGVPKIINVIAKEFPDIKFIYEYADEDTGYNCGYRTYYQGKDFTMTVEDGSVEAYDLAFKLRPEYKKYYRLEDGEYVCEVE